MYIQKISKELAQSFYSKYEHLGNCGLGVWHFGMFDNNELLSVVSYGTTCFNRNRGYLGKISEKYDVRIIQLTRGGTKYDAPLNIPSQIIMNSMKEIRKEFGNTIIIAYSDAKWNEIGTIYQSCNFHYLGLSSPKGQSNYIVDGKHLSGWNVRKMFGTRDLKKLKEYGLDVIRIPLNQKHRYLYVNTSPLIKKFINKEIQSIITDYPKRKDLSVGSMDEIREKLGLVSV